MTTGTDVDTEITSVFTGSGMGNTDFTHPDIGGEVDPDAVEENGSGDIKYTSAIADLLQTTESGSTESTSEGPLSTTVGSSTEATESSLFTTDASVSSIGSTTQISEDASNVLTSTSSAGGEETGSTSESVPEDHTSTTQYTSIISSTEVTTTEEYTPTELSGGTASESEGKMCSSK
jgi:hypothetical protein